MALIDSTATWAGLAPIAWLYRDCIDQRGRLAGAQPHLKTALTKIAEHQAVSNASANITYPPRLKAVQGEVYPLAKSNPFGHPSLAALDSRWTGYDKAEDQGT